MFGKSGHVVDPLAGSKKGDSRSETSQKDRLQLAPRPSSSDQRYGDAAVQPAISPGGTKGDVKELVLEVICAGGVGLHARPLEVAAKDVLPHQIDDEIFHTHRLSGFRGYAVGSFGHVGYYEGTGSGDQESRLSFAQERHL